MKYKKYIVLAFLGTLFLPLLSAKSEAVPVTSDNLKEIVFLELNQEVEFGFDIADYLPEGFEADAVEVPVSSINFIDEDQVELGFDTADYLPENFDPYLK